MAGRLRSAEDGWTRLRSAEVGWARLRSAEVSGHPAEVG